MSEDKVYSIIPSAAERAYIDDDKYRSMYEASIKFVEHQYSSSRAILGIRDEWFKNGKNYEK